MEAIHRARSFRGDATVLADYALTTSGVHGGDGGGRDGALRVAIRRGGKNGGDTGKNTVIGGHQTSHHF